MIVIIEPQPTTKPRLLRMVICVGISIVALYYFVALGLYIYVKSQNLPVQEPQPPDGCFVNGAVAADSEICSGIGRDILQKGGSAVDAAIAALLCTSIINPQSAGIGGGAIFTVMDSSGKVKIINSRETVPDQVNHDLLKSCSEDYELNQDSRWIAVPGEIKGYEEVHRLYGKLKWVDLFQPTIKLAREGFPIPYVQGQYVLETVKENTSSLGKFYSDENGNLLKTNDTVKFEKLADTLETIANEGADVFYKGTIAKDLISDIQKAGGNLTLEDLASYEANVTDAWNISLGEYRMYFPPPPSGGAILSLILNIMKGFKMNSEPKTTDEKILFYHRYIEALKFANGLKKHIRDPEFHSDEMAKCMRKDSFANDIRSKITNESYDDKYYSPTSNRNLNCRGTTHVSVLVKDGSAVSVTSSINDAFGSKVLSPSTGIILNNQLSDFCSRTKSTSPGERPPSNMAPAVLKSKSKMLVIGGSGGSWITTGMASALMNNLWFGKSLKEAIDSPVIYVNSKNEIQFELRSETDVINDLRAKGHKVQRFYNVVNAVDKDRFICAWSDERKKGKAAGY